jgi:Na+/melibiose symporter-like transporter
MLDRPTQTATDVEKPCADAPSAAPPFAHSRLSPLAPFQSRSFRFQWPADLLTSWAFEMETLILGWYVLVETGSVFWLTAFGAVQFLGTLVAPLFGVAGDRIGHRKILSGMRAIYAAIAILLTVLAFAGALTPIIVIVIASVNGIVRPSDIGVRGALVAETMPADRLIGAMSIARTTSDSARVAGALAGVGVVAMFGMGPAYVIIALLYVAGSLLTLGVTAPIRHISLAMTPEAPGRTSPWRELKEGISYIWNTPTLLALMWIAFLVNLCAFPLTNGLLPFVVRDVYGLNQTGLGYLAACFASGALLGSIVLSHVGANMRLPRLSIVTCALWYVLLLIFAQLQNPFAAAGFLFAAGVTQSLCMVSLAIVLLRAAGERFRGRVMGVRMLAIYSLPLGLLAAGPLIGWFGYRATASFYAIFGLVFTLIIALRWREQLWRG